jgi:nitrite reductase/ring-hydroxylating ferredoxin subunit
MIDCQFIKKTGLVLLLLFLSSKCNNSTHQTIPYIEVDFTIYPNSVQYADLTHYGGHIYLTGGVSGIVVYRINETDFAAYDRACPYDWQENTSRLEVDASGLLLVHQTCGSTFNILDGSVIRGPANYPLKRYRSYFDGMALRIYN